MKPVLTVAAVLAGIALLGVITALTVYAWAAVTNVGFILTVIGGPQ